MSKDLFDTLKSLRETMASTHAITNGIPILGVLPAHAVLADKALANAALAHDALRDLHNMYCEPKLL